MASSSPSQLGPSRRRKLLPLALALLALLAIAAPLASARAPKASGHFGLASAHKLGAPNCLNARALSRKARLSRVARRRGNRCHAGGSRQASTASAAPSSLYWGAWIGPQATGTEAPWDMHAATDFEASVGKSLSLIHFAAPFADCSKSPCSMYQFPAKQMESIREHGSIPFFSWSSQSTPSSLNEPEFQLADIIDGTYDEYIRGFATEAAAWGHPFFLRFDWEMNGNWFPWSEGVNGNQPGEYVAAWRHVHDIFASVGATNVTWTWCPNVDPGNELQDLSSLYPGDAYVDWTSLDGYNWGGKDWISFSRLFAPTYNRIVDSIAPSKPMIIGEVGSSENGGSKAQWIGEMLQQLPTEFPDIHGVIWFNKYIDGDWPIETSAAAESAFASGIQSSSYLGNGFGALANGTVPVPG